MVEGWLLNLVVKTNVQSRVQIMLAISAGWSISRQLAMAVTEPEPQYMLCVGEYLKIIRQPIF